ncbi:DsbE family thiol:disulfide interchange protein [Sulfitobacter sp. SK012]|uniref:DsbE family thiol:disulfide interchange protein n=1 Tax=Sulfitobacter sp. SK012 TaxID=1389005 RepID=UPI000E0A70E7|nr:DsbE family thiol:disulfide interchange protein [Sulfitobacter sp. SK012]AXI47196.1 DsbE family thiol:disulfide interchange protein [Sulfitobacter sp. SK012]
MKKLLSLLPLCAAIGIGIAGWWGLNPNRDPGAIPSVLIDKPVPVFELSDVAGTGTPGLATQDLLMSQEPILVNVFASWCLPCRAEHAVLARMVREEDLNLVGINYKDKPATAAKWLAELGNPYSRIGSDQTGRAGIEWGISGVPETFIVGPGGKVIFRHVGPISSDAALAKIRGALAVARKDKP